MKIESYLLLFERQEVFFLSKNNYGPSGYRRVIACIINELVDWSTAVVHLIMLDRRPESKELKYINCS